MVQCDPDLIVIRKSSHLRAGDRHNIAAVHLRVNARYVRQ